MSVGRLTVAVTLVAILAGLDMSAADEWPQWRGPNRDGVWAETGVVEKFDSPQLNLKWRVPIGGGYSGPTVADGLVYVADRTFEPVETERVHCFAWTSGKQVWTHTYDCPYEGFGYEAGPRASVLVDEGRAYSLGSAGHLHCFDAADGEVLWARDLATEYKIRMPNWGISASPVIENDLVIVQIGGEPDACVCAFDKVTGRPRWTALADDASYSAPIVIDQAGRRVLVCWTGDRITGLAPESGSLYWEVPFPWEKWPIAIATPVLHEDMLLMSEAHKGTILLRLAQNEPKVSKLWNLRRQETDDGKALHCLISTPYVDGGHVYGADSRGVLRCMKLDTGQQVWEDGSAVPEDRFSTIHLVEGTRHTWLFNERGELIIADLTPEGFREISRAKLIDPTLEQFRQRGGVTWSHPAYAYRHIFARNDKELVCADLSAN